MAYALHIQHIDRLPPHMQTEARAAFEEALVTEPVRLSPEQQELRQALGVA